MNVLVLHSELGMLRGGGENFTNNLFRAFVSRGHRVSVAFVADGRGKYPFALPPELEPIPIKGWWARNLGQASLSAIGRQLSDHSQGKRFWARVQDSLTWRTFKWYNQRFRRHVEEEFESRWREFDAVYVHGDTPLALMASQQRATVLRLPGPVGPNLAPMLHQIQRVCANGDALDRVRAFLGDHAVELPVGLDRSLFTAASTSYRFRLGWTDQHRVVGYVGRLTRIKGVDILAAAFRKLAVHLPGVRLLIIGSGVEEGSIRAVLAKEIARGIVHIEPDVNHDELPEWYRAMDLFVMPSRYENFSNAVLEAMACSIPVIASDIGGNRSLASAGAASLFAAESIDALHTCLKTISPCSAELKERGKLGARYVMQHHSWAACAERLENILHSLSGATR